MYYIYTRRRLCTTYYILEGDYVLHIYYKEIIYYIYTRMRLSTTYILEGDYVLHIY